MALVPIRTCLGCRNQAPKKELIRIVLGAAGEIQVDPSAVKPGRGAYLHPECVTAARRRKAIGRALRATDELDYTQLAMLMTDEQGAGA